MAKRATKKPPKKLPKTSEIPEERNITWQGNHIAIREAFIRVLQEKKRAPQITELCRETGLSDVTIKKHISTLDLPKFTDKARVLTEDIIMAIFRSATMGNTASQKLWMQIVENWTEKSEMKHDGGVVVIESTIPKLPRPEKNTNQ